MRLQYKTAGLMILIGVAILFLLTFFYANHNRSTVLEKELQNIKIMVEDSAQHMASRLKENAFIALTLSSTPILRDALLISNAEFDALRNEERTKKIKLQNRLWMETKSIQDPFIQKRMNNPVAEFLKSQQIVLPGVYGEIFLTNRHGVMIATTDKLTTLAHAHKYWWKAGYAGGKGRVFFDDRGFDASAEGYVLGVVVPVKKDGEIIGILKCNVNIMGPLADILQEHKGRGLGSLKVVRTKGLIVAELGKKPLSENIDEYLTPYFDKEQTTSAMVETLSGKVLTAVAPVYLTMGSESYGFGGNYESIDHIKGNKGEGWHIVITLEEKTAAEDANQTTRLLIFAGLIFTAITSLIAWLSGRWIAKPLVVLTRTVQKFGTGQLSTRVVSTSRDEIGTLAKEFNLMAENLEQTLTSRDKLSQEIELRKQAEETVKRANEELENKVEERTGDYKKAKEEAEQANMLKSEFLTNMSHELRTPIHHIGSYAHIGIKRFNSKKESVLDCFEKVISANNRMLVLIDNLFDLSRLEVGKVEYTFEENDVFQMVNESITKFSQQLEEKELSIVMDQPTVSSKIVCDRTTINQVVQNLISNSIKFTQKNKNIFILLDRKKSSLSVSIKDEGPGIPESEMIFIFDGFSQSSRTKTGAGGTGLGLAICKEIIEAHNGKIWAENNPEGGATFSFILPYVQK